MSANVDVNRDHPDAPPQSPKEVWIVLRDAVVAWNNDKAMRLAAAMAMYTLLSLAPLLVISIRVTGVLLSEEAASRQVERQVRAYLGPQGASAVNDMVASAGRHEEGVWATALSLGILLFTASGLFVELREALNAIWGIDPRYSTGWWSLVRDRLLSFGMILAVGLLLLISQVVTTTLTGLSEFVLGEVGWIAVVADLVVSTLVITALFAAVFRFLPDARVGWRYVWAGAAVTAVLFKIGQYLQALYFTYGATASLYGAAGSFVVVMLWVYYSGWILFFGAELIKAYAHRRGVPILPTQTPPP